MAGMCNHDSREWVDEYGVRTREDVLVCSQCGFVLEEKFLCNDLSHQDYASQQLLKTKIRRESPFVPKRYQGGLYNPYNKPDDIPSRERRLLVQARLSHLPNGCEHPYFRHHYHKMKARDILMAGYQFHPNVIPLVRGLLARDGYTKTKVRTMMRTDFKAFLKTEQCHQEGINQGRINRWLQHWISLKYQVLREQPPLRIEPMFYEKLDAFLKLLNESWERCSMLNNVAFPHFSFVLFKALLYVDHFYFVNETWYLQYLNISYSNSIYKYNFMWNRMKEDLQLDEERTLAMRFDTYIQFSFDTTDLEPLF